MFSSFDNFMQEMKNKSVVVVGIGVSNIPLLKLLVKSGAKVTACDKKSYDKLGKIAPEFEEMGVKLRLGESYLSDLKGDYLFKSPGIRPDIPEFLKFSEQGGIVTSEMEVFFDVCPIKIIAVTGSDGKTTTTTLISKMLEASGMKVHLGGNIGKPLLSSVPNFKTGEIAVVELSSFQLMTMKKSPSVAVITNLSPNHLDVHKSMEEYIKAKENIMKYQSAEDTLVVNLDNEITREIGKKAKGKLIGFSRKETLKNGVELKDNKLYFNGEFVLDADDILLPGIHNIENYMAAYAAVNDLITVEQLTYVAKHFGGVEHRIEFIREYNGVKYYNDSIASSPTRAMACINAFYEKNIKITMIAGGYDKNLPFDELGKEIVKKVKKLYLCGDTAKKIEAAVLKLDSSFPVLISPSFKEITQKVVKEAEQGDIVVLCPACASFDKFANFEERGNLFKKLINEI